MSPTLTKLAVAGGVAIAALGAMGSGTSSRAPLTPASVRAANHPGWTSLALLGSETSMGSPPGANLGGGVSPPTVERRNSTGPCAHDPDYGGWFHTSDVWIEDSHNCKVRLAGVTWYGMQTVNYVPAGLDFLKYTSILREIKDLGFNSIRIPLTDILVKDNNRIRVGQYIEKNPELKGLHPLQVLDRIVAAATKLHLVIILDNHDSYPITAAQVHTERKAANPFWRAQGIPEKTWIHDWIVLARHFQHNPTVIGFDLRNEPHTAGPGPWTLKRYLEQGATWGPYPNAQHPSKLWKSDTDWAAAATRCADAVLKINPHLLMFIEGVQLYPYKSAPGHVDQYWWGSILRGVLVDPIRLTVPNRVVYSPHEWGPWKDREPQFYGKINLKSMSKVFTRNWAFILNSKSKTVRAPIWLGEFNTCNTNRSCVYSTNRPEGEWFHALIEFLRENPEVGWSYYPINGTNSLDERSNNSILDRGWRKVMLPGLLTALRSLESQPAG